MQEMEEKLNSILGNPEMMSQIMHMAQSLGGAQQQEERLQPHAQAGPSPGLIPNGLDPAVMQKIASFAQQSGVDSQQQTLLHALRPYLSRERIVKLEKAMRAAKLAGLASTFLGSGGLSILTGR